MTISLKRPSNEENSIRRYNGAIRGVPFSMQFDINKPTQRFIWDILTAGLIYEEASTRAIADALMPGEWFFDIGANCGWFSAVAASLGARVVAFEPMKSNCDALMANVPSAMVIKAVVSDTAGEVPLYVNLDNDGGHTLWPCAFHPHNIETLKANSPRMRVQSVRMDDYAEYAPSVLKIDTEGAECNVLLGAEKVLSNRALRLVVCECHPMGLEQMGHKPEEIEEIMRRHGFTWEQPDGSKIDNWIFRR